MLTEHAQSCLCDRCLADAMRTELHDIAGGHLASLGALEPVLQLDRITDIHRNVGRPGETDVLTDIGLYQFKSRAHGLKAHGNGSGVTYEGQYASNPAGVLCRLGSKLADADKFAVIAHRRFDVVVGRNEERPGLRLEGQAGRIEPTYFPILVRSLLKKLPHGVPILAQARVCTRVLCSAIVDPRANA